MTDVLLLVGLLAGASGVPVEVVTTQGKPNLVTLDRPVLGGEPSSVLAGRRVVGRLRALTRAELTIETDGELQTVPLRDVLRLRFPASEKDSLPPGDDRDTVRVRLVDGSRIPCRDIEVQSDQAVLKTEALDTVRLPSSAIRSSTLCGLPSSTSTIASPSCATPSTTRPGSLLRVTAIV
ncbi:MAG TPA: hypothetical protein EYP14_03020 [Planctomycetaceae bacterium]|nr:hypothetical protein [Planctomycetaceae bacterium]